MKFHRLFKPQPPTALRVAVRDLEDAQVSLLEQHKLAEHYASQVRMLDARVVRLKKTVRELTEEQQQGGEGV